VAGIGPDEKIQLDGQKWDQFRFTGQPDLADLCDVHGRRSGTARRDVPRTVPADSEQRAMALTERSNQNVPQRR
jgi:hypothetical protein